MSERSKSKAAAREITAGEAARMLKVSRGTVQHLCEEGRLRAWRLSEGGWWRIDYDSVLEMLSRRAAQRGE